MTTLALARLLISTAALAVLVAADVYAWGLSHTVAGLLGALAWGLLPARRS